MLVVVRHGDIEDDFIAGRFAFLRQVAEPRAADERHLARIRRFLAKDDFQQRGFARAVRSDQPDALAGLERERDIVKQDVSAKGFAESGNSKHDLFLTQSRR